MGIKFNSSFQSKIHGYAKSSAGQQKLAAVSEAEAQDLASQAGDYLAHCVDNAISSSGLNGGAIAAIGEVSSTGATPGGLGIYHVSVHIGGEFRPSLVPEKYGGIDDMAKLFDEGYSAGGQVFGEWHGNYIGSLVQRSGSHFIEQGISDFMGNYPGPCEIISCSKVE